MQIGHRDSRCPVHYARNPSEKSPYSSAQDHLYYNFYGDMKRSIFFFIALSAITSLLFAVGSGEDDTIKRTFKVRPGGSLFLDIDRGTIRIRTISGSEVHVVLERRVKGVDDDEIKVFLERHEWGIRQDGNRILVDSRFEDEENTWGGGYRKKSSKFRLNVTVLVPEHFNIDFLNGFGNVEIEDLVGEIVGRTGAGNIEIGDIEGSVDVITGAGNIVIDSVDGYVYARSGAGNVEIHEVAGKISATTGAGNIEVTMTRQPQGDSELSSGAGNVTVYMDADIAVDVSARASLGSARCDFNLKINGIWMSKSFEGRLNGGGPALVLHSCVGNVSLLRN